MKLKICLLLFCCMISVNVLAQTAKGIEADFNKLYEKRNYWQSKESTDTTVKSLNALLEVSSQIEKKMDYYTQKAPIAMAQAFVKIGGLVSDDGLVRILSWDTATGGTQHSFENIVQYRSAGNANFITNNTSNEGHYVYDYDKLYTLNVNGKNYYLATYYGIFDIRLRGEGIRIFSIDNGKLNTKAKLIKTKMGLTNKLYYTYGQNSSNEDIMSDLTLSYDSKSKTITFPIVIDNGYDGQLTENVITYKFTGQYFEKVK